MDGLCKSDGCVWSRYFWSCLELLCFILDWILVNFYWIISWMLVVFDGFLCDWKYFVLWLFRWVLRVVIWVLRNRCITFLPVGGGNRKFVCKPPRPRLSANIDVFFTLDFFRTNCRIYFLRYCQAFLLDSYFCFGLLGVKYFYFTEV